MHLPSKLLHEVLIHFVEQRSEGLLSLRLAFRPPFAHKRPECAPHLVDILRADTLWPHHQVPIGELLGLEHTLILRDDLVEEALIHEIAVFQSLYSLRLVVKREHLELPSWHRSKVSLHEGYVPQRFNLPPANTERVRI